MRPTGSNKFIKLITGRVIRRLRAPCLAVPLLLLIYTSLSAGPPQKFTYQGNLRQSGFLVNGSRSMVFNIYSSSNAITPLWTSAPYSVQVSTGVFRAALEPAGIDWEAGSLWLELEVEGTKLSPREEITSVPFAINASLHSGKKYTTSLSPPTAPATGDLWMDTSFITLKFWNGSSWVSTAGSGAPHAVTHAEGGADPLTSLGAYSATGDITMEAGTAISAGSGSQGVLVSTSLIVSGILNPQSDLSAGGPGYSVAFASAVSAGWFYGNASGLAGINASNITLGLLSGSRIGNVIVSTHIVDGSILGQDIAADSILTAHILNGSVTRAKLAQDGCALNEILKWNGTQWTCSDLSGMLEIDPHSIHLQDTLQTGATFYVSSGTANYFNVGSSLEVNGTARIRGSPATEGIFVNSQGKVGVGTLSASNNLSVSGNMGVGAGYTGENAPVNGAIIEGNVGIGPPSPAAKIEVAGGTSSGDYIMIFKSGSSVSAWLRKK